MVKKSTPQQQGFWLASLLYGIHVQQVLGLLMGILVLFGPHVANL